MKVNGAPLIASTLAFPRVGTWFADLEVDAEEASAFDRVAIETDAGTFLGRIDPGTALAVGGRVKARAIGGNAGFRTPIEPKFYRSIPARTVLSDALAVGGEKLSPTSTDIDEILPFWTRHEATVGESFEECVAFLGCTWRVLDDGTVWVGKETWPAAKVGADAAILAEVPSARSALLADASKLRPGQTFNGRHVGRVEIETAAGGERTVAYFQDEDTDGDPVRVALTKIVRQMTRTIDFLAMYPARVVKQNGDGTLELRLSSERMPSMSRIPIRYGVPGVRAKVKAGSFVAVEFERGSPASPVATVWDRESVSELTIKADNVVVDAADIVAQNGRPLARLGDSVQVICTAPGTPAIGTIITGNNRHRG